MQRTEISHHCEPSCSQINKHRDKGQATEKREDKTERDDTHNHNDISNGNDNKTRQDKQRHQQRQRQQDKTRQKTRHETCMDGKPSRSPIDKRAEETVQGPEDKHAQDVP